MLSASLLPVAVASVAPLRFLVLQSLLSGLLRSEEHMEGAHCLKVNESCWERKHRACALLGSVYSGQRDIEVSFHRPVTQQISPLCWD